MMKQRILTICLFLLPFSFNVPSLAKDQTMTKKTLTWFEQKKCQSLEIKDFLKIGDKKPQKTKTVLDLKAIEQVMMKIEKLPTEGEMFKDFSDDTPVIILEFNCGGMKQSVEFYRGLVKTPGTSFLMGHSQEQAEIFKLVQTLLNK